MFVVILQFTCCHVLLYYSFMRFSVPTVLSFVWTVLMSLSGVFLVKFFFNTAGGLAGNNTKFNPTFFLKCSGI